MSQDRVPAKAAARQATRDALLEAATEMLFESPGADPIGALRPVEVARRAVPPRTNGAFYNIWPTQADFRRDLLHHVLSVDRIEVGPETAEMAATLLGQEPFSLAETVRVLANLNFDGLDADPGLRLKQALWSRHTSDPEVRDLLAGLYAGANDALVPMYQAVLERAGRRMRPPYSVRSLAVVLAGLAEGLHLRRSVDPAAVPDDLGSQVDPDGVERQWSLFAATAQLLITGMSEPASTSTARSGLD